MTELRTDVCSDEFMSQFTCNATMLELQFDPSHCYAGSSLKYPSCTAGFFEVSVDTYVDSDDWRRWHANDVM